MRQKNIHQLCSLILAIALCVQAVAPAFAYSSWLPERESRSSSQREEIESTMLIRTTIALHSPADWERVAEWQVVILEKGADWATVLVHDLQLETLARLGFDPHDSVYVHTLLAESADIPMLSSLEGLMESAENVDTVARQSRSATEEASAREQLVSEMVALSDNQKLALASFTSDDADGDGLTDTEEGWWCTNPHSADTDGDGTTDGDEVAQLLAGNNADGKPFQGWPSDHVGCFDDDYDSVPDSAEINVIGLNINRESTDGDKFDDGQEFFGSTKPNYGNYPRTVDSDFITSNMPGWVDAPGNSPFVAAYPDITVSIADQSFVIELISESVIGQARTVGETFNYGTTRTEGSAISVGKQESHTYSEWQEIGNTTSVGTEHSQFSSTMQSNTQEYYGEHSVGSYREEEKGGMEMTVEHEGSHATLGSKASVEAEVHAEAGCVVGIVCGGNVGGSVTTRAEVNAEVGVEEWTETTSGENWAERNGSTELTTHGGGRGWTAASESGSSYTYSRIDSTSRVNGTGYESTQATLFTHEEYEEFAVTNEHAIGTTEEWRTATAINTREAAQMRFSFVVKNSGTDLAVTIENLIFNIFIGDQPPISYYASQQAIGDLTQFYPNESHLYTSGNITLSLKQLEQIDLGAPVRIVVEDFSYGADEQFYENAWGNGVVVQVDDGTADDDETVDNYLIPTWGEESYQDVLKRYFPVTETAEGDIASIWTPEYDANHEITEWREHAIGGSSWWNIYLTQYDLGAFVPFRDKSAASETHLLMIFNEDSDRDFFSDRHERQLGTDALLNGDVPSSELIVGMQEVQTGDDVVVHLALENRGTSNAYGIEAQMFASDDSITVHNDLVGIAGFIPVGESVVLSTRILPAQPLQWTQPTQPAVSGHYDGAVDNTFTFTVSQDGTVGQTTGLNLVWQDETGRNGSIPVGAGYNPPTPVEVADNVFIGIDSDQLVAGEQFEVSVLAPRDVFSYTINNEPHTPPIIVVNYNDAGGNQRRIPTTHLNHVTDDLSSFGDSMEAAPELQIVAADEFSADTNNNITVSVVNPTEQIINGTVVFAYATISGTVVTHDFQNQSFLPGPTLVSDSWHTNEFSPTFSVEETYKVKAYLLDNESKQIDVDFEFVELLGSHQAPVIAVNQTSFDMGVVTQGMQIPLSLAVANIGHSPLTVWADWQSLALTPQLWTISESDVYEIEVTLDSADFSLGTLNETLQLRTNDPTQPMVNIAVTGTIEEAATGITAYDDSSQHPLSESVSVVGAQAADEQLNFDTTLALSDDTHPLWLIQDDTVVGHGAFDVMPDGATRGASTMVNNDRATTEESEGVRYVDQADGTTTAYVSLASAQPNAGVATDCYVASWPSNAAQCGQTHFYVGFNDYYGKGQTRGYLKFNLPSMPGNAYVQSSRLRLYSYSWQGSSSFRADLYRVNGGWSNPTWNNQPCGGCTYISNTTVNKSAGYYYWSTTSLVQSWYGGTANHGVMLRGNNEGHYGNVFYSAEGSNPPVLEITFATIGTPSISNISNGDGNGSYSVCWSGASGATSYQLQEKLNSGGWSTVYNGSGTCASRSGRSPGNWHYRVRGMNSGRAGGYSGTKSTWVKPTGVPSLSVPSGDADGSYTASWSSVTGATRYELQEKFNNGGWSVIHDGSATSKSRTGRNSGTWCYRVRAENSGGNGSWSATKCTVVAPSNAPELNPINNPDGSGDFALSWSATSGATAYEVQQQPAGGSWSTVYSGGNTTTTISGRTSGTWCYRVRASNTGGMTNWSNTECILVNTDPNVPTNLSPADGAGVFGRNITLTWQDGGDSDNAPNNYRQFRVRLENPTTGWSDTTGWSQSLTQQLSVPEDGTYQWQVEAYDGLESSGWSSAQTIGVYSLEKSDNQTMRLALPEAVTDSATYTVQYGLVAESVTPNQSEIVTLLLPNRSYEAVTFDLYLPTGAPFTLDIGNDGQHVWSVPANVETLVNSPDLAEAVNAYLATATAAWGATVAVPIAVSLDGSGDIVMTDFVMDSAGASDPRMGTITLSDASPTEETIVTIAADIHNDGLDSAENVIVSFYVGDPTLGGTLIGSAFLPTLAAGGNTTASILWDTAGTIGDVELYAIIDGAQQLAEVDETNNQGTTTAYVRTRPELQVVEATPLVAARQNQLTQLQVIVRNVGESAATEQMVALFDGTTLLDTATVAVPANATATVTIPFTPPALGDNPIRLVVDHEDTVSEYNERNNDLETVIYASWGAAVEVDAGNSAETAYAPTIGYGYLNGTSIDCNGETYREAGSTEQLQYQFDYLNPDRFYHLDLSFLLCNGSRDLRLLIDGVEVATGLTASSMPIATSLLLDPALYQDKTITLAVEKMGGGLGGPVVSELFLTDIHYCYRDSGHPNEVVYANAPDSCGWLDGEADQSWGTSPHQSVRYSNSDTLRYQFAALDSTLPYQLNLTFFESDNAGRVQNVTIDGVSVLQDIALSDVAAQFTVPVPAATVADGEIVVAINGAAQPVISEIAIEQVTLSSANPTTIERSITVGWQLLSLPFVAPDTPIAEALATIDGSYDLVYVFDAEAGSWLRYAPDGPPFGNTLSTVDPTMGLWVRGSADATLTMTGDYPSSVDIPLVEGWNLIGIPLSEETPIADALQSISGEYDLVYKYQDGSWLRYAPDGPPFGNTLSVVNAGDAYWVRATTATTLTISD